MPHVLAQAVEIFTTAMTIAAMGYLLASVLAARLYLLARLRARTAPRAAFAPGVSILKSLKGLDPGMIDAFRSHCNQTYAGEYELLFGVSSLADPAVEAVEQLRREFPGRAIRLIECPERLGANGKVSTLAQLASHARYGYLLINDSDITVSPRYLERVMACFAPTANSSGAKQTAEALESAEASYRGAASQAAEKLHPERVLYRGSASAVPQPPPTPRRASASEVGLVTALYRGRAHRTLASLFEALGIATDFAAAVLVSRMVEGGLRYGLGSTLAVSREALQKAGGLLPLVDHLADDYELGARVAHAGYRVVLCAEVVETSVAAYKWRGFFDHQLRWMRTVRDARPGGYAGLVFTHAIGWALLNVLASGAGWVSLWLLALSFFLRLAQAMTVGAAVLGDRQVLAALWLLPLRDVVAMGLWVAGFAGNTIVWRGERFALKHGKLRRDSDSPSQRVGKPTS